MSEETTPKHDESITSQVISSLSPVVKDIYSEALSPAAKEIGRALGTVGQSVNAVLLPIRAMVWGFDKLDKWLFGRLEERFKGFEDKMVSPDPSIAVPTLMSLCYLNDKDELREMFINLLASSMHVDSRQTAHPSFVEIIKQLTPDEAKIVHLFRDSWSIDLWQFEVEIHAMKDGAGYYDMPLVLKRLSLIAKDTGIECASNIPSYIDNLLRLGLVYETRKWASHFRDESKLRNPYIETRPNGTTYHGGRRLPELCDEYPEIFEIVRGFKTNDNLMCWQSSLRLTPFGKSFCLSCVTDMIASIPEGEDSRMVSVMAEEAL
jgi:hypothetical protein